MKFQLRFFLKILHMDAQLLQYHLLKRFSTELCFICFVFVLVFVLFHFDNESSGHFCEGLLLGYLVLVHGSMCFPFFHHHPDLIYICSSISGLILETVILPTIFFFKFVLATLGYTPFHVNFMSLSLQNACWDFDKNSIKCNDQFGKTWILDTFI